VKWWTHTLIHSYTHTHTLMYFIHSYTHIHTFIHSYTQHYTHTLIRSYTVLGEVSIALIDEAVAGTVDVEALEVESVDSCLDSLVWVVSPFLRTDGVGIASIPTSKDTKLSIEMEKRTHNMSNKGVNTTKQQHNNRFQIKTYLL